MVPVMFSKARCVEVLEAIGRGEAIPPPGPSGWTLSDLVALAGVAFAVRAAHGPAGLEGVTAKDMPFEHREAHAATLHTDLCGAVMFTAELARLAAVGGYDEGFEPEVVALVDAARSRVIPHSGFKRAALVSEER